MGAMFNGGLSWFSEISGSPETYFTSGGTK